MPLLPRRAAPFAVIPLALLFAASTPRCPAQSDEARPYLDAALRAERWIRAAEVTMESGKAWAVVPDESRDVQPWLYSGSAGVVLFYLELAHATGDARYLEDARAGADYLLAQIPAEGDRVNPGLYTGLAGLAYTIGEVNRATPDLALREGIRQINSLIASAARPAGRGVEWSSSPDIISGGAGIGLYLLHAADASGDASLRDLAARAGHRLIELAQPRAGGLMWPISTGSERNMPNFSHGTAGVAYFLARLHEDTGEPAFLDAALDGAKYLQSAANTAGGAALIFHDDPNGTDRYYLGWCHGPAGASRLFHQLALVTGDAQWLDWVAMSARGITNSGIPTTLTKGFWNNVGQCCGSAGVAEYFLSLHAITGDDAYLDVSRHMIDDMLGRASHEGESSKWIQAEHRVQPDFLQAQTGYMQGAAGIGISLLHLDGFDRSRPPLVRLPDSHY